MTAQSGKTTGSWYEIVVRGEIGPLLTAAFQDLAVRSGGGETVLVATVADQSEFYGLLDRLREFALELTNVPELPPVEADLVREETGYPADERRHAGWQWLVDSP
jgi:hypothetical protein